MCTRLAIEPLTRCRLQRAQRRQLQGVGGAGMLPNVLLFADSCQEPLSTPSTWAVRVSLLVCVGSFLLFVSFLLLATSCSWSCHTLLHPLRACDPTRSTPSSWRGCSSRLARRVPLTFPSPVRGISPSAAHLTSSSCRPAARLCSLVYLSALHLPGEQKGPSGQLQLPAAICYCAPPLHFSASFAFFLSLSFVVASPEKSPFPLDPCALVAPCSLFLHRSPCCDAPHTSMSSKVRVHDTLSHTQLSAGPLEAHVLQSNNPDAHHVVCRSTGRPFVIVPFRPNSGGC